MIRKINFKFLYTKSFVITFTMIFALLTVVGTTFSWITSSDVKINNFKGDDRIKIAINESFSAGIKWVPGTEMEKKVNVYNSGTADAFVRLSLEEITRAMNLESQAYTVPCTDEEYIPEYFAVEKYAEWDDGSEIFDTVSLPNGSPDGLVVKVSLVSSAANGGTGYLYAIYYPVGEGLYQKTTAVFTPLGNTLKVENIRYWGYEGYTESKASWGRVNVTGLSQAEIIDKDEITKLSTDQSKMINIIYDNLTDIPTEGKWYYNQEDGFFYYIGKVSAGSFSPVLINNLYLSGNAGKYYAGMELDLVVNVQATQNCGGALEQEWSLDPGSTVYAALEGFFWE